MLKETQAKIEYGANTNFFVILTQGIANITKIENWVIAATARIMASVGKGQ